MSVRLSVCIPAFQAELFIAEALESVLSQVPGDAEVIVVDDGSSDATAEVAGRFHRRIRVVRNEHRGIAATFNAAVAASSGTLLAAIDADDVWCAAKVDAQLSVLRDDPSVDVVFGHVQEFHSPGMDPAARARFSCNEVAVSAMMRGAMVLRRTAWDRVGPLDERLKVGEFIDWCARAREASLNIRMLPQLVLRRRIHGNNTMIVQSDAQADYLRLVRETLQRRRSAAGGNTSW